MSGHTENNNNDQDFGRTVPQNIRTFDVRYNEETEEQNTLKLSSTIDKNLRVETDCHAAVELDQNREYFISCGAYSSSSQLSKLIYEILQVKDHGQESVAAATIQLDFMSVLPTSAMMLLHDLFTPAKVIEILSSSVENNEDSGNQASRIMTILSLSLQKYHDAFSISSLQECWQEEELINNGSKFNAWIKIATESDESWCNNIRASVAALAAVLRLLAGYSHYQQQQLHLGQVISSKNVILMPEENIERSLRAVYVFLQVNYLSQLPKCGNCTSVVNSSVISSASKAKQKSKINSYLSKGLSDVAKMMFPVITSMLQALESFLKYNKQSDRICIIAAELSIATLRLEPISFPFFDGLDSSLSTSLAVSTKGTILVNLHKAASNVLRSLFSIYPKQRQSILVELLSLLNSSYSVKNPYRSFVLHHNAHTLGERNRYTSMPFIALLSCLQSPVSVNDGILHYQEAIKHHRQNEQQNKANCISHKSSKKKTKEDKNIVDENKCNRTDVAVKNALCPPMTTEQTKVLVDEVAKKILHYNSYYCSLFSAELFERCKHVEASNDYRSLALNIVSELIAVIQLPGWPISTLLMDQILRHAAIQLKRISPTSATTEGNSKRDTFYVSFLVELIGTACTGLRMVVDTVDCEQNAADFSVLSDSVIDSIGRKIQTVTSSWLTELCPGVTAASGKNFHSGSNKICSTKSVKAASSEKINYSAALEIMLEVTSTTIDVIAEQPQYQETHQNVDIISTFGDDSSKMLLSSAAIPNPLAILQQIGQLEELTSLLSAVGVTDVQYYHICCYLQQCLSTSRLNNNSLSISPYQSSVAATTPIKEQQDSYLFDALALHTTFWYRSSSGSVNSVVYGLLEKYAHWQQFSGNTQMPSITTKFGQIASTSCANPQSADNSVRGNYSIEAVLTANRATSARRSFVSMFESCLDVLLVHSKDVLPMIRAKSIKVIAPLLQCSKSLISRENIRDAITNRLLDKSISVREETVKLIGYYVIQGFENLSGEYLEGLKRRLHDEGVSVRKSVVFIFKDILLSQPNHPQYTDLCLSLLEKVTMPKEEETVKEIIRSTFQQIWFLPPSSEVVQASMKLQHQMTIAELAGERLDVDVSLPIASENVKKDSELHVITPDAKKQQSGKIFINNSIITPIKSLAYDSGNITNGHISTTFSPLASSTLVNSGHGAHIESTALQLVEISRTEDAMPWMIALLREVLHGTGEGDEIKQQLLHRRTSSFRHCERIVECLIELLLLTEERHPSVIVMLQKHDNRSCNSQIINIVNVVALFCEAHPPLIAKHIKTLLPYLKRDTSFSAEESSLISLKVAEILSSVAQLDNEAFFNFNLSDVVNDLSNMALRSNNGKNVSCAIHCLSMLIANVTNDAFALFSLADKCFSGIRKAAIVITDPLCPTKFWSNIQRCLMVLGYICEHAKKCSSALEAFAKQFNATSPYMQVLIVNGVCNSNQQKLTAAISQIYTSNQANATIAKFDIAHIEFLHPSALYGACYASAIYALNIDDHHVQSRAAQALCGVYSSCPRLMLLSQHSGLLQRLLGSDTHFDDIVHEVFITGLKEMMMAEEARTEKQQVLRLMKDSGVSVAEKEIVMGNLEQDSDSTIAGFALQQHLPSLMVFLNHTISTLRYTTLQLIGVMLRQGMLCPLEVVAQLIAMQGDSDTHIRVESLRILQTEDERGPTFIDNRMVEGVEGTYWYQMKTCGCSDAVVSSNSDPELSVDNPSCSILGDFYSSCVQLNKKRKIEFLYGLLRRCHYMIASIKESFAQHPDSFDASNISPVNISSVAEGDQMSNNGQSAAVSKDSSNIADAYHVKVAGLPDRGCDKPLVRRHSAPLFNTINMLTEISHLDISGHISGIQEAYRKSISSDFICSTLAYLPYSAEHEPLHIIYWINRNTTVSTSLLLQRLKLQLLTVGGDLQRSEDTIMQPPVLGSRSKHSKRTATSTRFAAKVTKSDEDGITAGILVPLSSSNALFASDGSDANLIISQKAHENWVQSLLYSTCNGTGNSDKCSNQIDESRGSRFVIRICEILLLAIEIRNKEAILRLKSFLKFGYNLTDEGCVAFNPDEKDTANLYVSTSTADKIRLSASVAYHPHPVGLLSLSDILSDSLLHHLAENPVKFMSDADSSTKILLLLQQITTDFNRVTLLLNNDPEDFTLTVNSSAAASSSGASNNRRKRKLTTRTISENNDDIIIATVKPNDARKNVKATTMNTATGIKQKRNSTKRSSRYNESDDEDWKE